MIENTVLTSYTFSRIHSLSQELHGHAASIQMMSPPEKSEKL